MEKDPKIIHKFQHVPSHDHFVVQGNTKGDHDEPSPARIEVMERRLDLLAQLMDGADFDYWLDGGVNVSLLNGRFIRDHKDIDISILEEDLDSLETQLQTNGYAIATDAQEERTDDSRCIELVSAREIQTRNIRDLQIVQLDDKGQVRQESDGLHFVDLHVNRLNPAGDVVVPYSGVTFPRKYFTNRRTYKTTSGHEIPISHPFIVAYHKAETGRDNDFTDMSYIQQFLSPEDKSVLIKLFQEMPQRRMDAFLPFLQGVFDGLNAKMSEQEIRDYLLQYPAFRSLPERSEHGQVFLNDFPAHYHVHSTMTTADCIEYTLRITEARERLQNEADEKVAKLQSALHIE